MIGAVPRALLIVLAAVALAAGGAWASAAAEDEPLPLDPPLMADLDGDGTAETVRAREIHCFAEDGIELPPCEPDSLRTIGIEVADTCSTGAVTLALSREMDFVSLAEIVDADNDGHARELAFEVRAGATARGVQAKVVRFHAQPAGCVAVRKTLFSYPRPATIGSRPKGTAFATGGLSIHDYNKAIKGLELRTIESYSRASDPGCCPSFRRVTFWRYVAAQSSYKPYRTKLTKLRRPT